MDLYQKLYAALVGRIDTALSLLETPTPESIQQAQRILQNALLSCEEAVIDPK